MSFATPDISSVMKQVNEQIETAKANAALMAAVSGVAASEDGRVTVTVNPTGALAGLELDPRAMRMASTDLAATIVATSKLAAQDAAAKVRDIWNASGNSGGIDVAGVAQGEVDIAAEMESRLAGVREALHRAR